VIAPNIHSAIQLQPLNSSVSNSGFEVEKPEVLKNSALALNRYFQD
jgi:hypothetical protein